MPSASSCLLHVLCFIETQYQTESKRDKNGRRFFWNINDFWEVKSTRNSVRGGHETGGRAPGRQARPGLSSLPISEGLSPPPCHGGQEPEGKPFSHLGRRSRKKKKEGGSPPSLPVAPECHQGPSSSPRSSPTTSPPSSPTLPPSMQRCNPSLTRCNLYLNMVLNAIYYSPMMYGYPMMIE